ncbi:ABC transporter substrate-binding protein [Umezawaea endophytica]|uniref:ABC transporter substrate-binding protein n=1 Tax=Umezawaea endophytica TaxID=1654476 RepID=A0A9X2VTN6_9PSEU|nr:ABC transporter substrate-binding protein [Umezawaea endophytica]MCS7482456.1 ABC transporter substrate-binding protein [Umezawaea endophytica]
MLIRRPRLFERDGDLDRRGDLPLPLVCLIREPGANGFLLTLDRALAAKIPKSPHVLATPADAAKHQDAVLPLLHALHEKLRGGQFGRTSFKRFDHYELAHHLTAVGLTPKQVKFDRPIEGVLRSWGRHRMFGAADELVDKAGDRAQLLMASTKFVGRLFGLYWGRDRVPGLGRERRWFMRQPYMVPRHSSDFFSFAERLTGDRRDSENPEQLRKLLVHAFLEDLRVAYRRTRAGFFPRRHALRRTTYVPVLLNDVDPAGWELLRLVNEVRNETGELDPLLFVTASAEFPAEMAQPSTPMTPNVAEEAFSTWKGRLPRRRQLLAEDARYLFVSLPASAPEGTALPGRDRHAWEVESGEKPRREPWLARRGIGEMLTVVVLLAALAWPARSWWQHWQADCAFFDAAAEGIATKVVPIDGQDQCVGYSDNAGQVFGKNPRLRLAQENVFAQNAEAARLHESSPNRSYFSLVYFAGLTFNESLPASEHSVAEELEGLVIRQRDLNRANTGNEPLLRIVVANGGRKMQDAHAVARDLLVPLFDADPTILAVIGLERSVSQTEKAIAVLGEHGITTLGTSLTKVGLDKLSPLYFQLAPDNDMQAELLWMYAQKIEATKVTVYSSGESDAYVSSLVKAVQAKSAEPGKVVSDDWWRSAPVLSQVCLDGTDRRTEIAFYAGREDEFGEFVRVLRNNCKTLTTLPGIVADDAVSRFVAHTPGRTASEFSGVSMAYVGMGASVVLAGASCVAGKHEALAQLKAFCSGYRALREEHSTKLTGDDKPVAPWPGERVGGLYDTASLFGDVVKKLRPDGGPAPHRAAVAQRLREQPFEAASGRIDFRDDRIANNRSLAILKLQDIHDITGPQGIPTCELMIARSQRSGPTEVRDCPAQG